MEINILTIAIIGFMVGAITNLIPLLGSSLFNFMVGVIVVSYQQLAYATKGLPFIPHPVYVFTLAYFVGTFIVKLLALIPSPLQPFFMMLRGTEP